MRISVIVPNLSGEIYLQDCRASVEAQTGFKKDEIELIIIDDDRNSPKGVAAMRNLGLEAASGDFVLFLDSDDYIADNALERLVEASAGYPDSLVALKFRKTWYKRAGELAEQEKEGRPAEKAAGQEKNDNHAEEDEFGVRDIDSVLGILIPKRFIAGSTGLRFNEELKYYSDIPFVAELMARGGDIISIPEHGATRCVYYKRNRNDAIRYPSLSQIKDKNRYKEFETACRSAHVAISNAINAETDAQGNIISIDEQPGETAKVIYARMSLWSCICDFVCNRMTRGKHPEGLEWDEETLRDAAKIMHLVPKAVITSDYKGCKKRILLRLQKGKTKAAQRLAKLYVMNRKKKGLFGSLSQWKWNIYKRIFRKLPVKENLFLFESFLGKSYGDSCRAIYEYMNLGDGVSGSKKPEFVWVIDNKDAHIPGKHRECKPLSLK
ncbi:MAG: glycosyltransferase, partial [Lachnospiraceae bacterium]|nr:glycosyltransferase [Lachnospiraceae bacterium]